MKCSTFLSLIYISIVFFVCGSCGLLNGEETHTPEIPGKIVFSAQDNNGSYQIFKMNTDGTDIQQLTSEGEEVGSSISPSWSPDGQQIIFSSFKQSTSVGPALWVMNADGSNQRVLYDPDPDNIHVAPLAGNKPQWSPDGGKIAFDLCISCQGSTNNAIYVFDIETEELTMLTEASPGYQNTHPVWSPDGSQIAFVSNRDYLTVDTLRFRRDLYIMDADGSNQRRITETGYARDPLWGGENSVTFRNSEVSAPANLYEANLQSKQITSIETPFSQEELLPFPLAWTPGNNQLLVYTRELVYPRENVLWIANLQENNYENIFSKPSFDNANPTIGGADWFIPN